MVFRGHVENGLIRLEDPVVLPEGAVVLVQVAPPGNVDLDPNAPTIEDEVRAIWADVSADEWNRLPPDLTDNLDHYVYGTPK